MPAWQKVVLVTAALVLVWRLLQLPAVSNSFWLFCTMGIIPGTSYSIAPDMALKLLIMLFPLVVLLFFRKEIIRAAPAQLKGIYKNKDNSVSKSQANLAPMAFLGTQYSAGEPARQTSVSPIRPKRYPSREYIYATLQRKRMQTATLLHAVNRTVVRVSRMAGLRVKTKVVITTWLLQRAAKRTAGLVRRGWRWLMPRLRQFDDWLNVTVHQSKFLSDVLEIGEACLKTVSDLFHSRSKRYYK